MHSFELYACMGHTDTTEGRGPMKAVCYAETSDVANAIVESPAFYGRWGVMGTKLGLSAVRPTTFTIYLSAEEFALDHSEREIRERALSKLTPDERRVLKL